MNIDEKSDVMDLSSLMFIFVSSFFRSSLSFTYPFPDVAVLMDRLYISRSSSVRPILQTLARIQSSTFFFQDLKIKPVYSVQYLKLLSNIYFQFFYFLAE